MKSGMARISIGIVMSMTRNGLMFHFVEIVDIDVVTQRGTR